MALVKYVYPRYAVHLDSGRAIPIGELEADCLWYPHKGLMPPVSTGHVLYVPPVLYEAMSANLAAPASVPVLAGEPRVEHLRTAPVNTSLYNNTRDLIESVLDHVRAALPSSLARGLSEVLKAAGAEPSQRLVLAEAWLLEKGARVLVPLTVGKRYQLFTDATEALLPVSPMQLAAEPTKQREPRLLFVVLATDLIRESRDSPWLSRATELIVVPPNAQWDGGVLDFVDDVSALRPMRHDPFLMGELAQVFHELTGGWPDLCDRFSRSLERLKDLDELRAFLREQQRLALLAERDPEAGAQLLKAALDVPPGSGELFDLPPPDGQGNGEFLRGLIDRPRRFTWEEHRRPYLAGALGWDRGLATPRSAHLARVLRGQMPALPAAGAAALSGAEREQEARTVRWLHVSDLHFSKRSAGESGIVLEALLKTVSELAHHKEAPRRPDLIFVTGDIANTGQEDEYALAEAYLAKLCEATELPRKAVHLVPGNHDVNRAAGKWLARTLGSAEEAQSYFQDPSARVHLNKLKAFREFYDRFYQGARRAAEGFPVALAEPVGVREVRLGVLPLCSAWFAQDDADSGHLFVGEQVVQQGFARLESADLRVVLVHHPLSDLSHIERKLVQDRIGEKAHFLLRGHLHETEPQKVASAYREVFTMAAGAAYQGRSLHNRALFVEVQLDADRRAARVRQYPLRYEATGHDRFTLDTSVYPRSYPTYLAEERLLLT